MVFLAAKVRLFLQNAYPDLDFVGSVDCHYSIFISCLGFPLGFSCQSNMWVHFVWLHYRRFIL